MRSLIAAAAALFFFASCASFTERFLAKIPGMPSGGNARPGGTKMAFGFDRVPDWTTHAPDAATKPPPNLAGVIASRHDRAQIQVLVYGTTDGVPAVADKVRVDLDKRGFKAAQVAATNGSRTALALARNSGPDQLVGRLAAFEAFKKPRYVIVLVGTWPAELDAEVAPEFEKIANSFTLVVAPSE